MKFMTKQDVSDKIGKMGYAATFTVIECVEDGRETHLIPGIVSEADEFNNSDVGYDVAYENDDEEVLHVEYANFIFGMDYPGVGNPREPDSDDLEWIREHFQNIQSWCDLTDSGRFKVLNPFYTEDDALWEDDD